MAHITLKFTIDTDDSVIEKTDKVVTEMGDDVVYIIKNNVSGKTTYDIGFQNAYSIFKFGSCVQKALKGNVK